MKYLIIDVANMMHRARYAIRGNMFDKAGLAMHTVLSSISYCWNRFESDHVILCTEGKSWRKLIDDEYKANRAAKLAKRSPAEIEEDMVFFEIMNDFIAYFTEKTNCTVLNNEYVEADDLIARWVQYHSKDASAQLHNHFTIISSDTDFQQLVAPNVQLYCGVQQKLTTNEGIFKSNGQPFRNKQGEILEAINPEYALFYKIVRGDTSDNIKPSYPRVSEKGSSNKTGIREAFEDRNDRGWHWNNFMKSKWTNKNGDEVKVEDAFAHNELLIDLNKQPDEIKQILDQTIDEAYENQPAIPQIGIHFLKFCGKYELKSISQNVDSYVNILTSRLPQREHAS